MRGGAATLVNPLDTKSIAEGLERVLDDPKLADDQRRRGLEQSREYDWDTTTGKTLEFYARVLAS